MGKTILITGASSGLGAEMARQFAALGHDLALCARRADRLEALRAEILAAHPERQVEVRALDVNDDAQVFEVFEAFAADFAGRGIDRVVVNAGVGKGAPLGTGRFELNRETAMTNFVAALAQTEAAMQIFRAQGRGHLVMISSMTAVRGMPKSMATYAATKAAVAHLAEGLRAELHGRAGFQVTVLYPGYIATDLNGARGPMMTGTVKGVRAMVSAIEKEVGSAYVPRLPWSVVAPVLRHAPVPVLRRFV
jgi:short-subunit dehydrogenase